MAWSCTVYCCGCVSNTTGTLYEPRIFSPSLKQNVVKRVSTHLASASFFFRAEVAVFSLLVNHHCIILAHCRTRSVTPHTT